MERFKIKHPITIYLLFSFFIFFWWAIAFKNVKSTQNHLPVDIHVNLIKQIDRHFFQTPLSKIDRVDLTQALRGDIPLMVKFIADWDLDAEFLQSHGFFGVNRISREAFLRSQLLGRLFQSSTPEEILSLQNAYRLRGVIDDRSSPIPLSQPFHNFLPQTYVSASFLLALANVEQIVAIPSGIREQTQLFPTLTTNKIHKNIDKINSEYLFHNKPEIAFVSNYSQPQTLDALRNQGIHLFSLNAINTLPEIQNALIRIGNIINHPLETELLTIFMDAALSAIDNRIFTLNHCSNSDLTNQKIMYLNYHTQFASPSSKTLTWQLLERLGVKTCIPFALVDKYKHDWSIPLNLEQIVKFNPDHMIIATTDTNATLKQLKLLPALSKLNAIQNNRLFFVDEVVQHSPSQFIVLAYYDLAQAISNQKLNQIEIPNNSRYANVSNKQILTHK